MATEEVEGRLDLIQLAATVISNEHPEELDELTGLLEALCRQRHLSVDGCLSPPRVAILRNRAPEWFDELREKHEWDIP
jgi:hypothetical protein